MLLTSTFFLHFIYPSKEVRTNETSRQHLYFETCATAAVQPHAVVPVLELGEVWKQIGMPRRGLYIRSRDAGEVLGSLRELNT